MSEKELLFKFRTALFAVGITSFFAGMATEGWRHVWNDNSKKIIKTENHKADTNKNNSTLNYK